jgi:beta-N-acetylhexosaminidase
MLMLGIKGTRPKDQNIKNVLRLAKEGLIGGIILTPQNIKSRPQLKRLVKKLKETGLLISIDQEGGFVQRLRKKKGFISTPSHSKIGRMSYTKAKEFYSTMANQSKTFGINLSLGPVVDLKSKHSKAIGQLRRSFSKGPNTVVRYAGIYIDAHRERGVITCLKHFPGHGLAREDSHLGTVDITKTFKRKELIPYKQLIEQDKVDMIMTGHLINKNWDPNFPASLSHYAITTILREKLGFDGITITDDLQMDAIRRSFSLEKKVVLAINAGNDILLFSSPRIMAGKYKERFKDIILRVKKIQKIIIDGVARGEISRSRIYESYNRIMDLKKKFLIIPTPRIKLSRIND